MDHVPTPHNRPTEAAAKPATVLAGGDDPLALELLTRSLAREGFRVLTARSGADALPMAREARPEAIILDVQMPGMDGWAVLTALKADPQLKAIPVVMHTMIDEHNRGLALGAADYLVKPV